MVDTGASRLWRNDASAKAAAKGDFCCCRTFDGVFDDFCMQQVKNRRMMVLGISLLIAASIWVGFLPFTLKFSLERHVIPPYPADHGSLREILDYYQKELAKQGMNINIVILDESRYDESRDVRGAAGNGYLFLFYISNAFDTHFKCGVWRTVTIGGVGSKGGKMEENK